MWCDALWVGEKKRRNLDRSSDVVIREGGARRVVVTSGSEVPVNVVFLSPHFPLNFWQFVARLRDAGANALAIADEPWERLRPELRAAVTEYYRVADMHRYDEHGAGPGIPHLSAREDRPDRLDERVLALDRGPAPGGLQRLGAPSGRPGSDPAQDRDEGALRQGRRPGRAGAPGARSRRRPGPSCAQVGYPLVAKPDVGVGASPHLEARDRRRPGGLPRRAPRRRLRARGVRRGGHRHLRRARRPRRHAWSSTPRSATAAGSWRW